MMISEETGWGPLLHEAIPSGQARGVCPARGSHSAQRRFAGRYLQISAIAGFIIC
jgi:hypothetical protein